MYENACSLVAAAEVFGDAAALIDTLDPSGPWRIIAATSQFRSHLGGSVDLLALLSCDKTVLDLISQAAHSRVALSVEVQLDASFPPYPVSFIPLEDGWLVRLASAGTFADVLRERMAAASQANNLANEVPVGLIYCAHGIRSQWANDLASSLLGLQRYEMAGLGWLANIDDAGRCLIADISMDIADGAESASCTVTLGHGDEVRYVSLRFAGTDSGFVVTVADVSDQVRANRELYDQARTDTLTGLPNRAGLLEALGVMLDGCSDNVGVAALFLDLDGFKAVDDTHGHGAGDALLIEVARQLATIVRPGDIASRLGGDEFVVALDRIAGIDAAARVAQRILDAISAPFVLDGATSSVTPSIGIATARCGTDIATLISHADEAMYAAKASGKACYAIAPALCGATGGQAHRRS